MKTEFNQYQLDQLRARFIESGYEPLNHSRRTPAVVGWVMIGTAITLIVAAFVVF